MNRARKKFTFIVSILSLIVLAIPIANINVSTISPFADDVEHNKNCYFNHYDAVAPTEDCHGSKEFWACCSHLSFTLEEPTVGTIHDVGPFSGQYFNELSSDDPRYVPALPKTRAVNFYCEELLIETQYAKDGQKISFQTSDDFVIRDWYREKELKSKWDFSNDVVNGNIDLFADFTPVKKSIIFNVDDAVDVDSNGFASISKSKKEICVSKGLTSFDCFSILEDRGIIFNKESIGLIESIDLVFDDDNFNSVDLYYGNTPLSFENKETIDLTNASINLNNSEFFVLQNTNSANISVESLTVHFTEKTAKNNIKEIPSVIIDTKNKKEITSRTEYVDCSISTLGGEKDVENLKAQIKIRGNSTAYCPKKPYRIKLDKKNSIFGYKKAKNWVLLADYMDASSMHNYTALKFAKMVRGKDSFGVDPLHVNVILNGINIGLYLFGEHIDEKEGRLDIEQENVWEKSFDEINFYIERDLSTENDPEEIKDETYFVINMENYHLSKYVFALKYPSREDFIEEKDDGEEIPHDEEFFKFFNELKLYMETICNYFVDYYNNDSTSFNKLDSIIDMESLALYGVIDQAFTERDHNQKSYKMYRKNGKKLKFGPSWDYDSCSYGLPYEGTYILNPYEVCSKTFKSTYIGDKWSQLLFKDLDNGRYLFQKYWNNITNEQLESFINAQFDEINNISCSSILNCELWMNKIFYCLFDNLTYFSTFLTSQLFYLKNTIYI